jgi:DNA polymerase III alpha subunit (gram-positive type)
MLTDETLLSDVEFAAFDLETTGLFAIGSQIVEIGAVRFQLSNKRIVRRT